MKACVDIGGTKIAVSLTDGEAPGPRLAEPTVKTGHPGALAEQVIRMVHTLCGREGVAPEALARVGVSSCGPFVLAGGQIELATPNVCGGVAHAVPELPNRWPTAPLEAPLRAVWPDVVIANDAVAGLMAERRWGALRGLDHCAYVTWSTGIGTGLCVDGHVLRGKHGNAGHAGHMFVGADPGGARCGCGNEGDVEGQVAGGAIARRFGTDAATLLTAAGRGDAAARAAEDALCAVLGRMLYNLVATLDLQRIALGGSVFWHHRERLLPRLQAEVSGRLPALTAGCELVPAGLGERVGDYAALALVSD